MKDFRKNAFTPLIYFMNNNQIFGKLQSGFCSLHCTETALVRDTNDLLLAANTDLYFILIVLDLISAFDTVEHNVLISCLKYCVGISDVVLDWSFSVMLGNASYPCVPHFVGFPRGLFWVPSFSPITCYAWGKSCIDISSVSIATQMTPNCPFEAWNHWCVVYYVLPHWN